MLGLYSEESIPNYQKRNGLTEQLVEKGLHLISKAFGKSGQLTCKELHVALTGTGINALDRTDVQSHIIRKAGLSGTGASTLAHSNGIFLPTIVVGGQVIGTWKVKPEKNVITIRLSPFARLSAWQKTRDRLRR